MKPKTMTVEDWLGKDNQLGIDIWNKKYRYGDETFEEWLDRVSGGDNDVKQLIIEKKFLFGGRILANRGLDKKGVKVTLSNCYVLAPPEDSIESIFDTASKMARTFSYGGGVGIDLSKLAPRGAKINNTAEETSGAVSFTDLYSLVTGLIGQHGRRGALMLSMSCEHPDIEEFMRVKTDLDRVTKANMSLRVTDKFMNAVVNGETVKLTFDRPETNDTITKELNAEKFFNEFCDINYDYGEPGCLFWDRITSFNMLSEYDNFEYAGTNPCVTGDTLIQTTEGEIPIKDLVGKDDVYVYCMDDNGELSIRKARKIWKTRENASLVEIRTHRGVLKCTPDHLIHTRNKGWIPACELKHGDKLTGLNRRLKDEKHVAVGLSGSKFIPEHRLVAGVFEDITGMDVHHIDGNTLNNAWSNLEVLDHSTHSKISNTGRVIEVLRDDKGRYVAKPTKKKQICIDRGVKKGTNWFVKEVVALVETEDVYDMTVEEYHNFIANGMVVHNCGEVPLPAGGSCLLGSLNLVAFVKNGKFQYDEFRDAVRIAVRALNDVLDEGQPLHPLEEQRNTVKNWRQIGLGIMGLADMLIKLEIPYNSSDARRKSSIIGYEMMITAIEESCRLAKEYGCFPMCNGDKICESEFISGFEEEPEEFFENIREYGLRNSQLLSIAPTGTISTMLGVSGGIEPIFAKSYTRVTKSLDGEKEYKVYTPIVKDYMEAYNITDESKLPSYFVTAQEIDCMDRVKMQAAWQENVDSSISSTVNIPEDFPKEQVRDIYIEAWASGCKGITVFRDGCERDSILTTKEEKKVEPTSDDLIGKKRKLITGCGSLHCTAFFAPDDGRLLEVYLSKGSTGGCNNFMVGLSRMISLAARGGCNIEEIIDQLKSCGSCPSYAVRTATKKDTSKGSCCPMAVAWGILDMYNEMQGQIRGTPVTCEKPKEIKNPCPKCGEELDFSGGCNVCKSCGWSRCD